MRITFDCPHCGKTRSGPDTWKKKLMICKFCAEEFTVLTFEEKEPDEPALCFIEAEKVEDKKERDVLGPHILNRLFLLFIVLCVLIVVFLFSREPFDNLSKKEPAKAALKKVSCELFKFEAEKHKSTINIHLNTDLPNDTIVIISVSRGYLKAGVKYSHDYFNEKSTVAKWKIPQSIPISDKKWNASLSAKQKKSKNDPKFKNTLGAIDSFISVSTIIPTNQKNQRFGKNNEHLIGSCVNANSAVRTLRSIIEIESPLTSPYYGPYPKIDLNWKNLPNAFRGHEFTEVYSSLKEQADSGFVQDKFETYAQFIERIRVKLPLDVIGGLNSSDYFAFLAVPKPPITNTWAYDPEKQKYFFNNGCLLYKTIPIQVLSHYKGEYIGSNLLGQKAEIQKYKNIIFGISADQFEKIKSIPITLAVPPSQARAIEKDLRVMYIVKPYLWNSKLFRNSKFTNIHSTNTPPTIKNPYEWEYVYNNLYANIHAVWIINNSTGKIIKKITRRKRTPKEKLDWHKKHFETYWKKFLGSFVASDIKAAFYAGRSSRYSKATITYTESHYATETEKITFYYKISLSFSGKWLLSEIKSRTKMVFYRRDDLARRKEIRRSDSKTYETVKIAARHHIIKDALGLESNDWDLTWVFD
jgi:hypothetical protein